MLRWYYISIHAAREGGDLDKGVYHYLQDISIHAAREGGDMNSSKHILLTFGFQSTPPVKAATIEKHCSPMRIAISIHAAREGGDFAPSVKFSKVTCISIHAAREGGDHKSEVNDLRKTIISIHAAREGGDGAKMVVYGVKAYFNPRRP